MLTRLVTTSPINADLAVHRARALTLGRYPSSAAAARTLATVSSLTRLEPLSAREAVLTDTPLRRATCRRSTANVCPLPGPPVSCEPVWKRSRQELLVRRLAPSDGRLAPLRVSDATGDEGEQPVGKVPEERLG